MHHFEKHHISVHLTEALNCILPISALCELGGKGNAAAEVFGTKILLFSLSL